MKKNILPLLLCLFVFPLFSQTGLYKNILGSQIPNTNYVPAISGLDTVSDGGYMISASSSPNAQYCAYIKLDSALNTSWIKTYTTGPYCNLQNAIELDDHGYAGVFYDGSSQICILKTDNSGNILFNNYYYLGSNGILSTGNLCRSAENDTGFVAIYAACAMHYGIAKFDKNGTPQWVKEYGSQGLLGGNVYDIITGWGNGYLSDGEYIDPVTSQRGGVVSHFGNQGQILNSKIIQFDTAQAIHSGIRHIAKSTIDQTYYIGGYTFHGSPFETDHKFYLMKLDTGLNPLACWVFNPPTPQSLTTLNNIAVAPDGSVIINGVIQDTNTYVYKFYMLKFDPVNSTIDWSKSVNAITSPQWYFPSAAINGIDVSRPDGNIVFPMTAGNDGSSIASIDLTGNGLCIAYDTGFTSAVYTDYIHSNFPMFSSNETFTTYTLPVTVLSVEYNDSTLCSPLGISDSEEITEQELYKVNISNGIISISSQIQKPVTILIFSATGQLLVQEQISPGATIRKSFADSGIYLIQAYSDECRQTEKIIYSGY